MRQFEINSTAQKVGIAGDTVSISAVGPFQYGYGATAPSIWMTSTTGERTGPFVSDSSSAYPLWVKTIGADPIKVSLDVRHPVNKSNLVYDMEAFSDELTIAGKLKGLQSTAAEIDGAVLGIKQGSNPSTFKSAVTSLATITSSASPSLTGLTSVTPIANGWESQITANTTIGSAVLTGIASTSSLVVGQHLYEYKASGQLLPTIVPIGARIVSIDSPTQITINQQCLATSSGTTINAASKNIKIVGGVAGSYGTNFQATAKTVNSATPQMGGTGYAIEFYTDAANFSTSVPTIIVKSYRNGTTPNSYKIAIDDVYQSSTPQPYTGADTGYVEIQLSTPGIHKVRIEFPKLRLLQNLYVTTGASIWKPADSTVKAAFWGDSYFDGGDTVTGWSMSNIANRIADAFGWDIYNSSVSGTGYYNNGGSNFNWQSPQRLNDLNVDSFDVVVIFGSVNDWARTSAQIKADALTVWQGIRERQPKSKLIIFGVPTTINTSAAIATTLENGLKDAFIEWNEPNSYFFPITTDTNGAWISTANTSKYIGADNTHLNDVGVVYISSRMVDKIKSVAMN